MLTVFLAMLTVCCLCCRPSRLICHSCPDSWQCSTLRTWPLLQITAVFWTDNVCREMDQFIPFTHKPLNWDWTWQFRQLPSVRAGDFYGGLQGPSCKANDCFTLKWTVLCSILSMRQGVVSLYEVPRSLSHTTQCSLCFECSAILCFFTWVLWNQELESARVFKLLVLVFLFHFASPDDIWLYNVKCQNKSFF